MKCLARNILRLSTALCTLALIFLSALWPRSFRAADAFSFQHSTHTQDIWHTTHSGLLTVRGSLVLYTHQSQSIRAQTGAPITKFQLLHAAPASTQTLFPSSVPGHYGFGFAKDDFSPGSRALILPLWFALLPLALLPLLALRKARERQIQRRRYTQGLCTACGYDLRFTPDRCPECGQIPDRFLTSS